MKILDALISKIAIIILGVLGVALAFIPLNTVNVLSSDYITGLLENMHGNYVYSLLGILIVLLCVKALFSGITTKEDKKNYVVTPMNFGDLKISDEAIEGLVQNSISRIVGIRSSKITVRFIEDIVSINIKGQVSPDINIPAVTRDIQNTVKDTIESHTGISVNQVNVDILSISSPMKSLK